MKKLLLGNEAIARGAYEAGVTVASAYPGTPSTEISENLVQYKEVYCEWAPNEKVAMEVAVGASIAGARSLACMKHVGVNVAADPLFTFSYTGVNGGMVLVVADDPGMHSSQNEQDSRFYARSAHIPMLEPSDSQECKEYVKIAYELSEKYDTPVMLRTTTRVAHSQSFVTLEDRKEVELKDYVKDITKYAMMPASAIGRHKVVEARENLLKEDCNDFNVNVEEINDTSLGIVCSGVDYQYVKEAMPNASVFKLGMVYPIPLKRIKEFSEKVDRLVVVESLEPFFENQLKANGIKCEGKNLFSLQGELNVAIIKKAFLGIDTEKKVENLPNRPPVMCAGCPHRGVYYVLNKLKKTVCADIGCYTLGAQPPLSAVDTVVCMGASLGVGQGFEHARGKEYAKNVVSVIGDSTFVHSGITGLINAVYNKTNTTLIILDNSTTGMTGHQDHPATGITLKGETTKKLLLDDLVKSCGVDDLYIVDAYDMKAVEDAIKSACNYEGVSVIIAQRPCVLKIKMALPTYKIDNCKNCGMCMRIGCPAISKEGNKAVINPVQCVGCGLCVQMCKFGCIKQEEK